MGDRYSDVLLGDISVETRTSARSLLIKSDGFPTYHGDVVDDHHMEITHICGRRMARLRAPAPDPYDAFGGSSRALPPSHGYGQGRHKLSKRTAPRISGSSAPWATCRRPS